MPLGTINVVDCFNASIYDVSINKTLVYVLVKMFDVFELYFGGDCL